MNCGDSLKVWIPGIPFLIKTSLKLRNYEVINVRVSMQ